MSSRVSLVLVFALAACSGDSATPEPAADAAALDASNDAATLDDAGSLDEDAAAADVADEDAGATLTPEQLPLTEPGPLNVGYTLLEATYTVEGTGEERTIPVHVWYPTEDTSGETASYGENIVYGLFDDAESWPGAALADPLGERYPVLVHSHGNKGFGGEAANTARHAARQGWVVISPDHVGDLLHSSPRESLLEAFLERAQDVSAALDLLAAQPADALGRAATDRVVLSGHSRGVFDVWAHAGATFDTERIAERWPEATEDMIAAFAAGLADPRVVAVIGLDGAYNDGFYGDEGYASATRPYLAVSGADRPNAMLTQFERTDPLPMVWAEVEGACHNSFTAGGACPDEASEARFWDITRNYELAFARHHLLGDASEEVVEIATGAAAYGEGVTVRAR